MNPKLIKVWFSSCEPNSCLTEYHYERLDKNLECDLCNVKPSFYLVGEKYKIGLCYSCLKISPIILKMEIVI